MGTGVHFAYSEIFVKILADQIQFGLIPAGQGHAR